MCCDHHALHAWGYPWATRMLFTSRVDGITPIKLPTPALLLLLLT
jgi:hypothetical protein